MRLTPILVAALLALTACKQDKPAPPKPTGGQPPAANTPAAGTDRVEAAPGTGLTAPTDSTDSTASTAGSEPAGSDAGTGAAPSTGTDSTGLAPSPTVEAPIQDRLEPPKAPPVPSENLLLLIHHAATRCRPNQRLCDARDSLGSKMVAQLKRSTELLKTGTDQQKRVLRHALLRVRDLQADELLASILIGDDGALDLAAISHVGALRSRAAVPVLATYLEKAAGAQAVLAIDTLARIGGEAAATALKAALKDKRLRPYWGEVCRGLARVGASDQRESVTAIGAALNATDRHQIGCRSAEAAFRKLSSGGGLNVNIDGTRRVGARTLFYHPTPDPTVIHMAITDGPDATCEAPGQVETTLTVPLDRAGQPVRGFVVPSVRHGGKNLGDSGAFALRFDAIEMKRGATVKGSVYVSHTRPGQPRVLVAGHFQGVWCGVSP